LKRLLLLFLLLLPLSFATEFGTINEPYTIWADITTGTQYYDAHNATLRIIDPVFNNTVTGQLMTEYEIGKFIYTFTPNQTGEYYISIQFYNTTDVISLVSSTLVVQENQNTRTMNIAIIIGFISLILYVLYLSNDLMKKPFNKTHNTVMKWLSAPNLGVFLHLLVSWLIVGLVGLMATMAAGQTYEQLIQNLFIGAVWCVGAFNVLYLTIYVMFTVTENINHLSKINK
jgi:hypothetical protein